MVLKQPVDSLTESMVEPPKPNVGDYERGQEEIDEAEEKRAEERLATAKHKIVDQNRQTLTLLEEVREIRRQLREHLAAEST
jgi:hypothetical protein